MTEVPCEVGDRVRMTYQPGPSPVFEVVDVEKGYFIHLDTGATIFPRDFDDDRSASFEVVTEDDR
jgi:hypothetical protein